jgi:hypothetical protein
MKKSFSARRVPRKIGAGDEEDTESADVQEQPGMSHGLKNFCRNSSDHIPQFVICADGMRL